MKMNFEEMTKDKEQGGNDYNDEDSGMNPLMPMSHYSHPDLIKWQLNQNETLEIIERSLRKQRYNYGNNNWEEVEGVNPTMNEIGIFDMITILKSTIHKNFALTNLTKDDIFRICKSIRAEVVEKLYLNHRKYKINRSDLSSVVNLIDRNVYSLLTKSLNDGERRHISQTTHISKIESSNNNAENPNKPNPLSALFGSS